MRKPLLYIFLLTLVSTVPVMAQDSLKTKKEKEFYIGLGSAHYRGDLGDGYNAGQFVFSAGIKLNCNKRFHGNFNLNIGSMGGNELDYTFDDGSGDVTTPNEDFKTNFISLNYEAHFNIVDKENFKFYLSQGVGLIRFVPKDTDSKELSDQSNTRPVGETYRNITLMVPTQLGVKYYLSNGYGIGIQGGFLNTLTDYLDNISQWGQKEGNDNVLIVRALISIPLSFNP